MQMTSPPGPTVTVNEQGEPRCNRLILWKQNALGAAFLFESDGTMGVPSRPRPPFAVSV